MSSTEQAFVKAFARRNRVAPKTTKPAPAANRRDAEGALEVDQSVAASTKVWIEPIESQATGQITRADMAESAVPVPHVNSSGGNSASQRTGDQATSGLAPAPQEPAPVTDDAGSVRTTTDIEQAFASLQHIHTAYAAAAPTALPEPPAPSAIPTRDEARQTESSLVEFGRTPALGQKIAAASSHDAPEHRVDPPFREIPAPVATSDVAPFHAVWEVDVFDVPTTVADLFFEDYLFQELSDRMRDAVDGGMRSMLVTSTEAGEGRSTVAIGIAMAAAASGIRVALIDADTNDPTLADDLRLDIRYGWVDTIRGGLPIKEVAVHAVEDGVTLIPLMPPVGPSPGTSDEVAQLVELLQGQFELIIIDGPAGHSENLHPFVSAMDSAVIVRDMTRTNAATVNELSYRLRESGMHGVGVVENFT